MNTSAVDVTLLMPQLGTCCGDVEDVAVPCHQVIMKLCARDEVAVCQFLQELIDGGLEKTLNKKIKEGLAAQDVDKINDLVRSALRVVVAVDRLKSSGAVKGWTDFMDRVRQSDRLVELMRGVGGEDGN